MKNRGENQLKAVEMKVATFSDGEIANLQLIF